MSKTITISVPDDLFKELKKFPEIKVSATCQEALQKELEDLKADKLADEDLLGYAERRFMEDFASKWGAYEKDCYKAGESWAAREAELEELKQIFEDDGDKTFVLQQALGNSGGFPSHLSYPDDDKDNELFFAFEDGAEAMWEKIKERLKGRGHEI